MADQRGKSARWVAAYWRAVQAAVPQEHRLPAPPRVMDDDAAKAFERRTIIGTKHSGEPHGQIPMGFLLWLADTQNELAAYLASDRARERMRLELGDDEGVDLEDS